LLQLLKVIAEPGRYYACSAFTLAVSVISRRDTAQTALQQEQDKESLAVAGATCHLAEGGDPANIDHSKSIMYYINDGVYASFNCLFYDHAELRPQLLLDEARHMPAEPLYKSSVWGPTCDGLDLVVKEAYLPELPLGEFLAFRNMGAYTLSGAVAFNGIPLARCIYVVAQSWDTIRDAFVDAETADEPSLVMLGMLKEAPGGTCAAAGCLDATVDCAITC
jgi:ornithine decarboxylase